MKGKRHDDARAGTPRPTPPGTSGQKTKAADSQRPSFDASTRKELLPALRTAATAAAAATAAGALLSLVHLQRPTAHIMAVESLHGARRICAGHLNESETARASGFAIIDQRYRLHRTVLFEQGANSGFVHGERKIANIHFRHVKNTYQKKANIGRSRIFTPVTWIDKPSIVGCGQGDAKRRGDQKQRTRKSLRTAAEYTAINLMPPITCHRALRPGQKRVRVVPQPLPAQAYRLCDAGGHARFRRTLIDHEECAVRLEIGGNRRQ